MARLHIKPSPWPYTHKEYGEDRDGYQYVRGSFGWVKVGHKDDPPCTGSGYSHKPHGKCTGYSTDRT